MQTGIDQYSRTIEFHIAAISTDFFGAAKHDEIRLHTQT
jgi:hypothetical protein